MTSEIRTAFRLATDYVIRLTNDIPADCECRQPTGVNNHPVWTLGHLCGSLQAMAGELGQDPWLPEEWVSLFETGTQPSDCPDDYPSLGAVRDAFVEAVRRLDDTLRNTSSAQLQHPLPDESYRRTLPTVGHAAVHILVGHLSVHAGQLSVWRAAVGLERQTEHFDRNSL